MPGKGAPPPLSGTEICRGTRSHGANVRAWTCQVQSLSYTCLLPVLTYFYHLINYYFVSLQCVQLLAIRKVLVNTEESAIPGTPSAGSDLRGAADQLCPRPGRGEPQTRAGRAGDEALEG